MPKTKIEQSGAIEAMDRDGGRETLHIFTRYIDVTSLAGQSSWMPVSLEFQTAAGGPVHLNADGTFREAGTGRVLVEGETT
jgi:hypothetical protein